MALLAAALYIGFGRLGGAPGGAVTIDWPANLSADQAAEVLAAQNLVASPSAMALFLHARGGTGDFVAGPHLLPEGASPDELCALLSRSPGRPRARVTIPEGFTRFDVAKRLESLRVAPGSAFLAASADPALLGELGMGAPAAPAESAEGYLFPATYDLPVDEDAAAVVRKLAGEADKRWRALAARHPEGLAALASTLGWSRHEVLTLASIIEKEAMVDEERPLIASVFLNRLRDPTFRPKRLQSDPTAAYGCLVSPDEAPSCAGYAGKPTPAINADAKNRYSTYARAGLPPGPIANPGEASIEAVLAPSATRYFYFVAAGQKRHTFSETLGAHNDAVRTLKAGAGP